MVNVGLTSPSARTHAGSGPTGEGKPLRDQHHADASPADREGGERPALPIPPIPLDRPRLDPLELRQALLSLEVGLASGSWVPGVSMSRIRTRSRPTVSLSMMMAARPQGIATAAGHMVRADAGGVFALFVLPEVRGRGFGSRFLPMAGDWLEPRGVETAWLHSGEEPTLRAYSFSQSRRWRPVGGQMRLTKSVGSGAVGRHGSSR